MFFKNATYPWTKALTVDTLRPRHWAGDPDQTWLRVLTDRAFMLYQTNLFFGIGSLMSLAGVWLLVRALRTSWPAALGTRAAALVFLGAIVVIGVGIHGARQTTGLAFIALQLLIYMVVELVIGQVDWLLHWGRVVVFGGVAVDFVFGVLLQIHVESEMAVWARSPNWDWKHECDLVFLGELVYRAAPMIRLVLRVAVVAASVAVVRTCRTAAARGRAPTD